LSGRTTLVLIGDSISAGAAASRPDKGYVALLTKRLTGYSLINYSRGGWSVHATKNYVEPAYIGGVPPLWPNEMVIVLGTNDFSVSEPLAEFRAGYRELLDRLARALVEPLRRLFCVTPFPRLDEDRANTVGHVLDDYRLVVQEECSRASGIPLDGSQAIPASVAYFSDTIHPNDRGHASIASWLLEQLRAHGVGRR
jgi:lysophospholipase L1-like esterase